MIRFVELFAGIGGFRYGLEACNGQQQESTEVSGCEDSVSNKGKQPNQSEKWGNNIGRNSTDCPNNESRTPQYKERAFRCVWSNDNNKYASAIYRKQYGEICEQDIRTVDPIAIPEHELLCAGFPCQSFSIAGQRGGFADIRGTLFQEICRIVGVTRTPYLFLENVKGLLSAPYTEDVQEWGEEDFDENGEPTATALKKHKAVTGTKGWVFLTILNTLWELGYNCQWQVLNSKDYGVPQNRERVFIIGHLGERSRPKVFPIGENNKTSLQTDRNGLVQTKDNISGCVQEGMGRRLGMDSSLTLVRTRSTQEYTQRDISPPVRQSDKNEVRIVNVPQAQRIRSIDGLSSTLQGNAGGQGGKTGLYEVKSIGQPSRGMTKRKDDIAYTLRSGQGGAETPKIMIDKPIIAQSLQTDGQLRQGTSWGTNNPQSSRNIRRLTPIECERLQGFPDNWTKYGIDKDGEQIEISDTQRYKCCGNAVTTNVIKAIGEVLLKDLVKQEIS